MKHKIFLPFLSLAALILVVSLACSIGMGTTQPPTQQPTQVQPTNPPPTDTPLPPPTNTPIPPPTNTPIPPPTDTPVPSPTQDVNQLIESASILLYDDTLWQGLWVKSALDDAGYSYYLVSGVGDLMANLTSAKEWDLVIIAAEARGEVSGEFWDILVGKVNDGTALIYETWTLDLQGEGKVKQLLNGCGVKYQANVNTALPIFFYVPDHAIFNTPNTISRLRVSPYWIGQNIDLVQISGQGDAEILAGTEQNGSSSAGVITTCYGGRVILSTFSNHDYYKDDVEALWQNYVYFTLKNHFLR